MATLVSLDSIPMIKGRALKAGRMMVVRAERVEANPRVVVEKVPMVARKVPKVVEAMVVRLLAMPIHGNPLQKARRSSHALHILKGNAHI